MNIKDYREKELRWFIVTNIFVIVILSFNDIVIGNRYILLIEILIKSGIFLGIIYSFTMIFDGVLSDNIKKYIVFQWRPQPGEVIFSKLKKKNDTRFSTNDVEKHYSNIYANMPEDDKQRKQYENNQWYIIYKKYEKEPKIRAIQRDYLLCRDMAASIPIMIIIYLILIILDIQTIVFSASAIIYFILVFIICIIAANNKAERLVTTVIASDLSKKNN